MPQPARRGLTVLDHPLIRHKVTLLRDTRTSSRDFKQLVSEIAALMTYEVTRDLATQPVEVVTPLEATTGEQIAGKIALVPILRAGLGMVEGIVQLIPNARVGHIGLYRNHETLQPVSYYFKVPTPAADHRFFMLDPMLATGGSLIAAINFLLTRGAVDVTAVCLIAAPEGLAAVESAMEGRDVTIVLGAVDEKLNEVGYIVPGLGDAGDRLYGLV